MTLRLRDQSTGGVVGGLPGLRGYRSKLVKVSDGPPPKYRWQDEVGSLWGPELEYSEIFADSAAIASADAAPGAVDADLASRSIGFVDEGSGEGHFTVGGVPVSGTLVPPAATWSGVAGKPAVMGVGSTSAAARAAIDAGSVKTTFYDDFTTKVDGTVSAGAVSDSGHTYTVHPASGDNILTWAVASGRLTHTQTNPAISQSSYLGVEVGSEAGDKVGYVWADFEVPAGSDPIESIVLIVSEGNFATTGYSNAATHCVFRGTSFIDTTNSAGDTVDQIGYGDYTDLAPGVYRVEVTIDGGASTITAPDGKQWRADAADNIADWSGPWATLQLYNPVAASRGLKVLRWGAELQSRMQRGTYASPHSVAVAVTEPPRLLGAMQTSGSGTTTAITSSLSAKLYGLTIPIPASRRILVEGSAWFLQFHPAVKAASQLAIGAFVEGVGAYGKLATVYSGYTPANASVDASAFADRQGTESTYDSGQLFPFSMIIDLDPAFTVGYLQDIQVMAQAGASSQWTFVDSGDGLSGFDSLRASTLKIWELPA